MRVVRATVLAGLLIAGGAGAYLTWALTSDAGYEGGGRALKGRYGLLYLPEPERRSLRKLAMMKAASHCEWELDEEFWGRIYRLYVGEEHSVRAAVYAALLEDQERYFQADDDHRRCEAAWSRFGAKGAEIRGVLRAAITPPGTAPGAAAILDAKAIDATVGDRTAAAEASAP
ncbi:hypothetical protein MMB17_07730 [Methylobacterium organophilum]|uniref:hypothetical protein n=1 Tax=Methylobacterium organophilum TaxID=410 RepID=UPI001F1381DE|nr:hypothetical protein [Methylobacterium organophilum]UMY19178.1 hypothetical protein MMB17_07730 [Methylobacterium organophilum]